MSGMAQALEPVTPPRVYYFGCGKGVGHRWFAPPKEGLPMLSSAAVADAMRTVFGDKIDCGFAPRPGIEGDAKLTRVDGWTVLAWWDNSVDKRPNSNSALVCDLERDFNQMVALLYALYPEVAKRQRVPIKWVQMEIGS